MREYKVIVPLTICLRAEGKTRHTGRGKKGMKY
jgi:hypothetical protein